MKFPSRILFEAKENNPTTTQLQLLSYRQGGRTLAEGFQSQKTRWLGRCAQISTQLGGYTMLFGLWGWKWQGWPNDRCLSLLRFTESDVIFRDVISLMGGACYLLDTRKWCAILDKSVTGATLIWAARTRRFAWQISPSLRRRYNI